MKTIAKLTIFILILLGNYSCNGDVFIDDFAPSVSELKLDGNGDSSIIHFASSNWEVLSVYCYDNNFSGHFQTYDADGNLVGQQPYFEGLGKIVCEEVLTGFTIERNHSDELKITANENLRSSFFQFNLLVGNEYESREINVTISPSEGYVIDHITYSLDAFFHQQQGEDKETFTINNPSETPFTFYEYPFKDECHEVIFVSDLPEAFRLLAKNNLPVEIPSLTDDGNLVMDGKKANFTSERQALPLPFPNTVQQKVVIPAYARQRITLLMMYEWFETEFTLYAIHTKTKKQRIITGTLQSKMPKRSFIKRETINN